MKLNELTNRKLADQMPIPIILSDKNGIILWWNKAAEKLLKLNNRKYKNLNEVFIIENKKNTETILVNHPETHVSLSFLPYKNQTLLLFVQDITHLHHLERMRQDFVANVSHELRTPLTVIHGYLELLNEKTKNKNLQKIFNQMYQQSFRMEKLVEDLLLLSRLETDLPSKENFKPVNIKHILSTISQDAKTLSAEKNHTIKLDVDKHLQLVGLEDQLQSAFANLIFNAVNYTPENGEILIRWFEDNGNAYLQVKDTGIGIAAEHLPRLTERFYRVDRARSRKSGGTGLGLAIVKHALIHHNAQLKIDSELGKGSTFTCVFPKELIIKTGN